MTLDVATWTATVADEGSRLAAAAERAGLDATVPSCPGWTVRDLVAHVGGVHRWATFFVTSGTTTPTPDEMRGDHFFTAPDDRELLTWFRAGHEALVTALRSADPDLACWSFLDAPSPLAFWARRQAHETTVHRVDAELAIGERSEVALGIATDGIDELLTGFYARSRGRLVADPPVTLAVRTLDTGAAWSIEIGPDSRQVSRGTDIGDCVVSGPAPQLYLFLWNRRDVDGLRVTGDDSVLELWRTKAQVRWS